jgi:hypothetical protein
MRKQTLFYIFKLSSGRIRKANYKIELSIEQSRKNGEIISLNSNQVIQSVLRLRNREFEQENLNKLFIEKKKLQKKESSSENIEMVRELAEKIDDCLFIKDVISVWMEDKKHYAGIIKNGFSVNGVKFVRLLCGAGHSRRNTVIFCSEEIENPLKEILNNGRKISDMVIAKNNAYFALAYSGTMPVSEPYFCVIPDCEIKRTERVHFIDDYNNVLEQDRELDFNLFDGQGIISPRLAKQWASDIGIEDYIPSAFIIRNSFLKGMVCTVDFHSYSEECEVHLVKDVWGNIVNIRDMDLVLTASQFKAWNSYESCREYLENCRKNNFSFGISRVTPKEDKTHVFTNYQFLQVLDLDDADIRNLCSKTVEYLSGVSGGDVNQTLLYLLGNISEKEFDEDIYEKINDVVTKALILNNELIADPYVQAHILHSLSKKIKDSYMGCLLIDGNYSMVVQDPVAFMEHLFGFEIKGLLKRNQHYSNFWNQRNVERVASMRAPLTWRSENNILNLKKNSETENWYKYLDVGVIVYNVLGCDMMLHADGDSDGDLVMTTNQPEFINRSFGGIPVTYEKRKAEKKPIIENELWQTDILSFESRIGYITNCSTTLYAMLPEFAENTEEHKELIDRLIISRKLQGNQIDLAKGISIDPFPQHWVKWTKIDENNDYEDLELAKFNNRILIDKRPYFFRYLYSGYNKNYINFVASHENFCMTKFKKSIRSVLDNPETEEEIQAKNKYLRFVPLLDSNCVMNNICHHLEKEVKEIRGNIVRKPKENLVKLLKNNNISLDSEKLKKLYDIFKIYKSERRNIASFKNSNGEEIYKTLEQYGKHIRKLAHEISSDDQELANLAVVICYEVHPSDSKTFAWNVFGEGIVRNVEMNCQEKIFIPQIDRSGDIEYLGKRYSMKELRIFREEEYLNDYL